MKELGRVSHTHLKTHSLTIQEYSKMFPDARFAFHPDSQKEKIKSNLARSAKIQAKKFEYWAENKGKTIEQIRGKNSADLTKSRLSKKLSGKNNPAYGKVYEKSGGRNVGWYKGFIFRSLYEYSFLKFLEATGKDLLTQVKSENYSIPYVFEGTDRTYHPDFEVEGIGVVEIKSVYETTIGPACSLNDAKFAAAQQYFSFAKKEFKVMTECDFPVYNKNQAKLDPNVSWVRE